MFGYISPSPEFNEFFSSDYLEKLIANYPFRVTGIGGHRVGSFLGYEKIIDRPIFYFSFVRKPLSRYLSHFNWQKNVKKIAWTVDSFLEESYFNNFQCYRIAGKRDFASAKLHVEKKYSFVGIMEEYDASVLLLYQKLGFDKKPFYKKSNKKNHKQMIDLSQLNPLQYQRLVDNNHEDIRLYNYIKEVIFPSYLKEYKFSEKEKIWFNKVNRTYSFPLISVIKRKITNTVLKKLIQPCLK